MFTLLTSFLGGILWIFGLPVWIYVIIVLAGMVKDMEILIKIRYPNYPNVD